MRKIIVYRVEHPATGMGPWHSHHYAAESGLSIEAEEELRTVADHCTNAVEKNIYNGLKHPSIWCDFGRAQVQAFERNQMVCGTKTLRRLRSWFADVAEVLFDAGFTIKVYTIDQEQVLVGKSKSQVAFRKEDAVDVKDLTILPLVV